jgi:hypothetical protein
MFKISLITITAKHFSTFRRSSSVSLSLDSFPPGEAFAPQRGAQRPTAASSITAKQQFTISTALEERLLLFLFFYRFLIPNMI